MIESLSNTDILRVSGLQRWHMIRMRAPQSLAEHSYNVCMLSVRMVRVLGISVHIGDLMEYALCHDAHETEHGDVPSPSVLDDIKARDHYWMTRKASGSTSDRIRDIVYLMDKLEAYIHYIHHGCNGRMGGVSVKDYLYSRVLAALRPLPESVKEYVERLIEEVGPMYCNKQQEWR